MSFIKNLFGSKAQPVMVVQGEPIAVETHSQFIRNVNRLVNLYRAKAQGDARPEIEIEIEERRQSCLTFGHDVPYTLEAAEQLQTKVNR